MSVSNAPTLCGQCSPMFQGLYSEGYGMRRHHASLQSLEQAANKNCIICRDVWKAMTGESDFDREILNVIATQKGGITECSLFMFFHEGFVAVDTLAGLFGSIHLSFECKKTQRESALQPSQVRTLFTNVKQWNITPHSMPHPCGLDPPPT